MRPPSLFVKIIRILPNINPIEMKGQAREMAQLLKPRLITKTVRDEASLCLLKRLLSLFLFAWQSILEAIPDIPVHTNGSADAEPPVLSALSGEWLVPWGAYAVPTPLGSGISAVRSESLFHYLVH